MIALALRIIAHSPMRYLVALLGISVAAGLAFIQLGLYRGFRENASVIVDHTDGDLWVCAKFAENFDFPKLLNRQHLEKVRATPGVAWAAPMLVAFANWKLPETSSVETATNAEAHGLPAGKEVSVQMIGFDAELGIGRPWRLIEGFPEELFQQGALTVDISTRHKLGGPELGTIAELNGKKCQVQGLTQGIRSFQGNPMLFTDWKTIQAIRRMGPDDLHYVIVGLAPGAEPEAVLERLRAIEFVEAYTSKAFALKAQEYWLKSTGAGTALALAALMGLIVGIVVAGQVLYTSTLEHIKEYGTLKAIGASNPQVAAAIVTQAVAWALPAHLIAGGLLWIATTQIEGKGIHLSIAPGLWGMLGFFTVLVCVLASILSVVRVMRLEPADVFKG